MSKFFQGNEDKHFILFAFLDYLSNFFVMQRSLLKSLLHNKKVDDLAHEGKSENENDKKKKKKKGKEKQKHSSIEAKTAEFQQQKQEGEGEGEREGEGEGEEDSVMGTMKKDHEVVSYVLSSQSSAQPSCSTMEQLQQGNKNHYSSLSSLEKYFLTRYETSNNPIYGEGFRNAVVSCMLHGFGVVVQCICHTKRFPTDTDASE
tara:strand:+ start:2128 stop:2736 length:609 start_codon:yes stop_codon:yes gene_type:complete